MPASFQHLHMHDRFEPKNPDAEMWLEFHPDGTIIRHDDSPAEQQTGQWKWEDESGRVTVSLFGNENFSGFSGYAYLKGQKPPYIVEYQRMQFCSAPDQSPAIRERGQVRMISENIGYVWFFSIFLLPFFLPARAGIYAFGIPFLMIMVESIWRMVYLDRIRHVCCPVGIAYVMAAVVFPVIALVLYLIIQAVKRWWQRRHAQPVS